MKTENIQKLREDYSQSSLDESDVNQNPIKQFEGWLNASIKAKLPEPNAMTLSTVDSDHKPHSRIILLKGIEEESFIFYSNYGSDKGKEMEDNPNVSLCFLWKELERQVEELEFCDQYAYKRSRATYQRLIRKHFTFVSARVLESKFHFKEDNTALTDLLFRF
jgi:pyridoxamine-phosphate oxidase